MRMPVMPLLLNVGDVAIEGRRKYKITSVKHHKDGSATILFHPLNKKHDGSVQQVKRVPRGEFTLVEEELV